MSSIVVGQTVVWTVRSQGVHREARGEVIALCDSGDSPKDRWPKTMKKPEGRDLLNFGKPRQMAYAIVKEVLPDNRIVYRTPPLHSDIKAVVAKPARRAR